MAKVFNGESEKDNDRETEKMCLSLEMDAMLMYGTIEKMKTID